EPDFIALQRTATFMVHCILLTKMVNEMEISIAICCMAPLAVSSSALSKIRQSFKTHVAVHAAQMRPWCAEALENTRKCGSVSGMVIVVVGTAFAWSRVL
ncbi:MAG: hypothetical protein ABW206_01910, partial [Agrobacterium vaccinii]